MKFSSVFTVYISLLFVISSLDEAVDVLASPSLTYSVNWPSAHLPYLHQYHSTDISSSFVRRADESEGEDMDVICHPAGACEPCPEDLLHEPFCLPFGNRRLLHCNAVSAATYDSSTPDRLKSGPSHEESDASKSPTQSRPPTRPPQSAVTAWESCGRRVPKERADFFEFVLCNIIFAALALVGVLVRTERMRAVRARRLAARIGVGLRRASSGSWAVMGGMGGALTHSEDTESTESDGIIRQDATD
ncbi:hypothetical protein EW145_g5426 [Phellinidium pouzarii]|uniref:Uncharacterized protein n=1 Tax=Phellinidium pouzarii TaxID=167371 RepID=A0A4S4L009_9AGAM|nr:hypothetical protein EW145_g5426 [Phellinidium pouzarii]